MSIQRTTSTPHQWKYDVFLSFRGEDTRRGFTDQLYKALNRHGIKTFRDDPQLQKGEAISPALFAAIEESRIALVVLSQNYASSTWCLNELLRILECMKARGAVLPIFYDVDPSDVRKQTGNFGEAFVNHEEKFRDDKEKLQRWRSALFEVASLSGWNSKDWYESELLRDIVQVIWKRLRRTSSFSNAENLVGIYTKLQPVHFLIDEGVDEVRFIGIWGMGGIGKTTMVRAVYERIFHEFEFNFLLTDVRSSVAKSGLLSLQKQLLSGVCIDKDDISDHHVGASIIRRLLGQKKVLLVLDDVNHSSHLKYLAGNQDWFGPGSRVLITTRDEHLLIEHGVERRLKVEELTEDDSLQLFSLKAFKRGYPEDDFLGLSKYVIRYARGLPLALEVLGSLLYGRDPREWDNAMRKLGRVCNPEIFDILKISYDGLDYEEKKIFLDIACFFNGQDRDRVTEILNISDFSGIFGIRVLTERSLLTVADGKITMHDLLQEMGREIVRQTSPDEPGRCSRLWLLNDVEHVMTNNTGTEAIEGIYVDTIVSGAEVDVAPKSFSKLHNLRYLKIKNANLPKGLEFLPNSLRILNWKGYPLKSLPAHFNPQKLWELKLCDSCIEHVHIGKQPLYNLKTLNLSHSLNLVTTPNFRDMPHLEFLLLEGCTRLYEVDQGIEMLGRLSLLNLKDCKNLMHFASTVSGLKSLKDLNLSGCSKLDKLPDDLGYVACLEKLDLSGSGIRELPSSIDLLKNLKELSLARCKAESVKSWNPLELLRKKSHIPAELSLTSLFGLYSLTELDLSDCNLSEGAMPDGFGCLASLKSLDLRNNQFVSLPESICQLSRLNYLYVEGCHKLRVLPEFGSDVWINATNCISLESLTTGQHNSIVGGNFGNCSKLLESESYKSLPLYLAWKTLQREDYQGINNDFMCPGNEIPEWYDHQSVGSSVKVELHPGWLTEDFMGFVCCIVLDIKPLPSSVHWWIEISVFTDNGQFITHQKPWGFGEKWGQPMLDHIWCHYISRNRRGIKELRNIYCQLDMSFHIGLWDSSMEVKHNVKVKKCGVRVAYKNDVKELQTILEQSNTEQSLHDPVVQGQAMSLEIHPPTRQT